MFKSINFTLSSCFAVDRDNKRVDLIKKTLGHISDEMSLIRVLSFLQHFCKSVLEIDPQSSGRS